jgi:hypothetical protein
MTKYFALLIAPPTDSLRVSDIDTIAMAQLHNASLEFLSGYMAQSP